MLESTRLLRDLVALPSVNPMGRPLPEEIIFEHRVSHYLEDYFRSLGTVPQLHEIAPRRVNVVAFTGFAGARRTYLWEVHQDTVPVDGMTIDPFGAAIEHGRLSGRGACDVKGGMAAMLAAFGRLVREQPAQSANVLLACTVDEEHTFLGVQDLMKRVGPPGSGKALTAAMAIVAEPTLLQIVNTHKGVVRWDLQTTGRSCHSSRPDEGDNAIYHMGSVLTALASYAEELPRTQRDPELGPATLSVGRILGGTSVNTVPDRCRIEIDRRLIPGEDAENARLHLLRYLQTHLSSTVKYDEPQAFLSMPPLSAAGSEEVAQRLGDAINTVMGGHRVHGVPFGTDASTVAAEGIPAVIFGPGDISKAHTCDEWIDLEQVEQAAEILYRFACAG